MTCTDIIQAVATVGLMVVAIITVCYGISQYESFKSEKRPYISLIRVVVESNLIKEYPIISPTIGKNVKPEEIINGEKKQQDHVEEIIIDLTYKNTGPIAAKDIDIRSVVLASDRYNVDGTLNINSKINDNTDFKQLALVDKISQEKKQTKLVSLLPEQEKTDFFMLHRNELGTKRNIMRDDSTTTNHLYIFCSLKYKSTKNETYKYFCVYRIYHPAAYTRIYCADLITSETT